jgi:hypothetical protein
VEREPVTGRRQTPPGLTLPEVQDALHDLRGLRDEMALRRVWAHVASPEEAEAARELRPAGRGMWFVGGALTAAGAAALALWFTHAPRSETAKQVVRDQAATKVATSAAATRASHGPAPVPVAAPASEAAATPRGVFVRQGEAVHSTKDAMVLALPGGAAATLAPSSALKVEADGRVVLVEGRSRFDVPLQTQSMIVEAGSYRVLVAGTRFRVDLGPHGTGVSVAVESGTAEVFGEQDLGTPLAHLAPGSRWSSDARPGSSTQRKHHRPSTHFATAANDGEETSKPGESAPPSIAAENAAYERGRILRDVQHRPEAALEAWRDCRAEHPNGVLRPEVDLSIFETLVRGHDVTGALSEGTAFLARYPQSERRSEVARLVGDLYRGRGDLRRAVQAYDQALAANPRAEVEDQASFARAEALFQAGIDPKGANLTRYLDSHPAGRFRKAATNLLGPGASRAP